MEYKAFIYYESKMFEKPKDFSLAYYGPRSKSFIYYACSLIIESDNSYRIIGPDEWLKKKLDDKLKYLDNRLAISTADNSFIPVHFLHPDFKYAFARTVNTFSIGEDFTYTGTVGANEDSIKVNSMEDVKRLDREYAAQVEREKAEALARGEVEPTQEELEAEFERFLAERQRQRKMQG